MKKRNIKIEKIIEEEVSSVFQEFVQEEVDTLINEWKPTYDELPRGTRPSDQSDCEFVDVPTQSEKAGWAKATGSNRKVVAVYRGRKGTAYYHSKHSEKIARMAYARACNDARVIFHREHGTLGELPGGEAKLPKKPDRGVGDLRDVPGVGPPGLDKPLSRINPQRGLQELGDLVRDVEKPPVGFLEKTRGLLRDAIVIIPGTASLMVRFLQGSATISQRIENYTTDFPFTVARDPKTRKIAKWMPKRNFRKHEELLFLRVFKYDMVSTTEKLTDFLSTSSHVAWKLGKGNNYATEESVKAGVSRVFTSHSVARNFFRGLLPNGENHPRHRTTYLKPEYTTKGGEDYSTKEDPTPAPLWGYSRLIEKTVHLTKRGERTGRCYQKHEWVPRHSAKEWGLTQSEWEECSKYALEQGAMAAGHVLKGPRGNCKDIHGHRIKSHPDKQSNRMIRIMNAFSRRFIERVHNIKTGKQREIEEGGSHKVGGYGIYYFLINELGFPKEAIMPISNSLWEGKLQFKVANIQSLQDIINIIPVFLRTSHVEALAPKYTGLGFSIKSLTTLVNAGQAEVTKKEMGYLKHGLGLDKYERQATKFWGVVEHMLGDTVTWIIEGTMLALQYFARHSLIFLGFAGLCALMLKWVVIGFLLYLAYVVIKMVCQSYTMSPFCFSFPSAKDFRKMFDKQLLVIKSVEDFNNNNWGYDDELCKGMWELLPKKKELEKLSKEEQGPRIRLATSSAIAYYRKNNKKYIALKKAVNNYKIECNKIETKMAEGFRYLVSKAKEKSGENKKMFDAYKKIRNTMMDYYKNHQAIVQAAAHHGIKNEMDINSIYDQLEGFCRFHEDGKTKNSGFQKTPYAIAVKQAMSELAKELRKNLVEANKAMRKFGPLELDRSGGVNRRHGNTEQWLQKLRAKKEAGMDTVPSSGQSGD